MYATMKKDSAEVDECRVVDVRSDTVSKPTQEMMQAMMEVSSSFSQFTCSLYNHLHLLLLLRLWLGTMSTRKT